MNHPDEAPAFVLSRAGYDVWLGNQRGSRFSRKHTTLDPESKDWQIRKEYFDYSFQEMADFDAPTQMNVVLEKSGADKLTWIGHSMGTTQLFYGLQSKNADYFQDRINLFIALAPVTRIDNIKSTLIRDIDFFTDALIWMADTTGIYEVFGDVITKEFSKTFCVLIPALC